MAQLAVVHVQLSLFHLVSCDLITVSKAVGKKTDSVSCELEGILFGLKLTVDYFHNVCSRRHKKCVYIVSDYQ